MAGSRSPRPSYRGAPGSSGSSSHHHFHPEYLPPSAHSSKGKDTDDLRRRGEERHRLFGRGDEERADHERRFDHDRPWAVGRSGPFRYDDKATLTRLYEDYRPIFADDWKLNHDRHAAMLERERDSSSRRPADDPFQSASSSSRRDPAREDSIRSVRRDDYDRKYTSSRSDKEWRRNSPSLLLPPRSERLREARQRSPTDRRSRPNEDGEVWTNERKGLSIRGSSSQTVRLSITGRNERHDGGGADEDRRQESRHGHSSSDRTNQRRSAQEGDFGHVRGRAYRFPSVRSEWRRSRSREDDRTEPRDRGGYGSNAGKRDELKGHYRDDDAPPRKLQRRITEQEIPVSPEAGPVQPSMTADRVRSAGSEEGEVADAPEAPPAFNEAQASVTAVSATAAEESNNNAKLPRVSSGISQTKISPSQAFRLPMSPRPRESESPPPPPPPPMEEQPAPPPPLEEGETVADPPRMTSSQRRKAIRARLQPLKDRIFVGCSEPSAYRKVDESNGGLLGMGTFGEVSRAKHIATGTEVALKKIRIQANESHNGMPITAIREIKLLKELDHPNICPVVDMVYEGMLGQSASAGGTVCMVLPYMQHDLNGLIERLDSEDKPFSPAQIKLYMKQLLEGTLYLHQNKILHRDIKAANILISNDGSLRIADFGLARPYHDPGDSEGRTPAWRMDEQAGLPGWRGGDVNYTSMVVTRWYRPPELLAGERKYGPAVDMWGLGCILAEMILRRPMFKGASEINQLELIAELCGSPNDEVYPGWTSLPGVKNLDNSGNTRADKNERGVVDFGRKPRRVKERFMGMVRTELADLIDKLLTLDPRKRLTAEGALSHKWFDVEPLPADPASLPQYPDSKEATKGSRAPKGAGAGVGVPMADGHVAPLAGAVMGGPTAGMGAPMRTGMGPGQQPVMPMYAANGMAEHPYPPHRPPIHHHPHSRPPGMHRAMPRTVVASGYMGGGGAVRPHVPPGYGGMGQGYPVEGGGAAPSRDINPYNRGGGVPNPYSTGRR